MSPGDPSPPRPKVRSGPDPRLEVSRTPEATWPGWVDLPLGAPANPGALGTLENYELIALIGSGGMGVVFGARDLRDGREVALKALRADLAQRPRFRSMFLKEARHQQALNHPRVLPILDCIDSATALFLVLPWMRRGSLAGLLGAGKPLERRQITRLARDVAEAAAYAHARGIIHRDLKPTNVLLDESGAAVLADFGLARSLWNDELTDPSGPRLEGTVAYLSPAAARGEVEDTRADVYAFGALMYEMLTGEPPYAGGTPDEVVARILAGPPQRIPERNPAAAVELVAVAEGAMARDLRDRYVHMRQVLEDLARVAEGRPPLGPRGRSTLAARLALTGRRMTQWTTAHPGRRRTLAGVGMVLGSMILAAGLWAWTHPPPRLRLNRVFNAPGFANWSAAIVTRWDRPDSATLIAPTFDRVLFISSADGVAHEHWRPVDRPGELDTVLAYDTDGDGLNEAFVGWRDQTNLFVSMLNYNALELRRFAATGSVRVDPPKSGIALPDSSLLPRAVVDLEADGHLELLASLSTGFALRPRGLRCFDLETGQPRWSYETAGSVIDLVTLDFDGDGRREVVLGTDATDNGLRLANGTTDQEGYVHCLSHDGTLRWRIRTGGVYTRARPVLARQDEVSTPALFVVVRCMPGFWKEANPAEAGVLRLDAEGRQLARFSTANGQFRSLALSGGRLLISDGDGMLYLLDPSLQVLASRELLNVPPESPQAYVVIEPAAETDLDGDGRMELLVAARQVILEGPVNPGYDNAPPNRMIVLNPQVIVLDSHLRELARHTVATRWESDVPLQARVAQVDGDSRPEILALADQVYVLQFRRAWRSWGPEERD